MRPVQRDDLPALLTILAMADASQQFFGAPLMPAEMHDRLASSLDEAAANRGECWIAAPAGRDDEPLAYAEIVGGWLSFFVHAAHRRRQVASTLIGMACRRAGQARPLDTISTWVLRENIPSVRLLEKTGFRFAGLEWHQTGAPLQLPMLHFTLSAAHARLITLTEDDHAR